jgi:hypothetical protein
MTTNLFPRPVPDRVSILAHSPHYMHPKEAAARLEVTFNGIRQMWVEEYCVSEGWIIRQKRTALGQRKLDADGGLAIERLNGLVVVSWK